jgi:hypothetical protein
VARGVFEDLIFHKLFPARAFASWDLEGGGKEGFLGGGGHDEFVR